MGMAASQARYLGLTARKTNCEYEGQQINQARTALSNQSANLWNQMLTLSVPVAPNTTDFTKVQYSFSDGYNDYTISNIQNVDQVIDGVKYNAQVTYYYNQDLYKAIQAKNTNPQVQKVDTKYDKTSTGTYDAISQAYDSVADKYTISNGSSTQVYEKCTATDATNLTQYNNLYGTSYAQGTTYKYVSKDVDGNDVISYLSETQLKDLAGASSTDKKSVTENFMTVEAGHYRVGNSMATKYDPAQIEQKAAYDQIIQDFPALDGQNFWVFEKNGKMCFSTETDLDACIASGTAAIKDTNLQISSAIDYQSALNQYSSSTITEKVKAQEYAILDDASGSGRYSNVKLQSMSANFDLHAEEVTDKAAYDDAMNQYNYNVTLYEKKLADINAKTSIIQEQDRTLELRLKQLETEQNAVKTEMDAVKGIIKSNVESTFKTFS